MFQRLARGLGSLPYAMVGVIAKAMFKRPRIHQSIDLPIKYQTSIPASWI